MILLNLPIISAQLCSLFNIRTFCIFLHVAYAYLIWHHPYPIRYINRWITLEYLQLMYQFVTITFTAMSPSLRRLSLNMVLHRPIPLNHSAFISFIHIFFLSWTSSSTHLALQLPTNHVLPWACHCTFDSHPLDQDAFAFAVVLAQTSRLIFWDKLYRVPVNTMANQSVAHTPISAQFCPDI